MPPDESPLLHYFGTVRLQQHPRAFFQACPAWAWQAFGDVFSGWSLGGDKLFDLYGGGGFFSRLLAPRFERFTVVESSSLALADARANLVDLDAQFHEIDVERGLASQPSNWATAEDTVLLDPPRSGLTAPVADRLRACGARQVVLIGCDGAAFCRDLRRICDGGRWRLNRLAVIDLFPSTSQAECVGLLCRDAA